MYTTFQTADGHAVQARTVERAAAAAGTTDLRAMPPGPGIVDERWWTVRTGWGTIDYHAYRTEGEDWTIAYSTRGIIHEQLRPGTLGYRAALASMPDRKESRA